VPVTKRDVALDTMVRRSYWSFGFFIFHRVERECAIWSPSQKWNYFDFTAL
jgi:hypothetical protein